MERDQIHAFGLRKKRTSKAKNKTVTPRLAFFFALKLLKARQLSEKEELRFCYSRIIVELAKMIPGCF